MEDNILSNLSFEWFSPERLKITRKLPKPRQDGHIKVKAVVTGFYKNELERMTAKEFIEELEKRLE